MDKNRQQLITALALLALVSVCLLGQNLLESNEAGKLALALRQVEPDWNTHDWYLNTPQTYQWLFQQFSGQLLKLLGTSIGALACRLTGYAVWAWAVASVCGLLGLSTATSLGAVAIFLTNQSLIAGEWMLGGAEPKTFSYAALLFAFVAWQKHRWRLAGLMSGLACAFHILVGGYGAVTLLLAALLLKPSATKQRLSQAGTGLALGILPTAITLGTRYQDFLHTPVPGEGVPSVSWIYTYLRNPHHLVPSSWSGGDWSRAGIWLILFCLGVGWSLRDTSVNCEQRRSLGLWSALSLTFFGFGLFCSTWDREGTFLRFYPFRLADTLIPLSATLLLASQIERLQPNISRLSGILLATAISLKCHASLDLHGTNRIQATSPDISDLQRVYQWLNLCTPPNSRVLTPPSGFEDMSLKTGRAGVAQFKQIPNRSRDVREWFQRMQAMGGDPYFWAKNTGFKARRKLNAGFYGLSGTQLAEVAKRYDAQFIITAQGQTRPEGWLLAYSNGDWNAWSNNQSAPSGRAPRLGRPKRCEARTD